MIYQHCMLLQELGYSAYPLMMGAFEGNYFGFNVECKSISQTGFQLSGDDIIVCPELTPYDGLKFSGCKRVLFAQNWWQLYDHRFHQDDFGKSYKQMGYDHVMYCGDYIRQKLDKEPNENLYKVRNYIDQVAFHAAPDQRIKGSVLALYRKQRPLIDKVVEELKALNIEVKLVEGLTQEQIIREYQQADIFFASGFPEGFGLPPLEAMKCGAAVVGYTGGGASEFMIDGETALVVDDGDYYSAAKKIGEILKDDELREYIRHAGQVAAEQFTKEYTKKQLQAFYEALLAPTNQQ